MYLSISQFLRTLLSPLGLSLLLWSLGILLHQQLPIWGTRCEIAGISLLLVCSNPLIGRRLLRSLEDNYPSLDPESYPQADAIVVLGTVTTLQVPSRLIPDVNAEFSRLLQGVRLLRAERAPVLVMSGGVTNSRMKSAIPEAVHMKSMALELGVEPGAILLEERAQNTYENALFTRDLLRERGAERILLVTSAAHMPRAAAVFRTQGLEVIPVSVGVRTVDSAFTLMQLLPTVKALELSTIAMKEYLGFLLYYLRGWIRKGSYLVH